MSLEFSGNPKVSNGGWYHDLHQLSAAFRQRSNHNLKDRIKCGRMDDMMMHETFGHFVGHVWSMHETDSLIVAELYIGKSLEARAKI